MRRSTFLLLLLTLRWDINATQLLISTRCRDMVVIVAGNVSDADINTIKADGWKVYKTDTIANPGRWTQQPNGRGFPSRFWGVYTKLALWNLTDYDTIVYLDADTVVSRNIDELFLCDGMCAVLRAGERFNTGVMVISPDEHTFNDMLSRVASTPSYTGGDQGFLNEYFSELARAPLFDPGLSMHAANARKLSEKYPNGCINTKLAYAHPLARLPTWYNADLGLYIANSYRWALEQPSKIGVLHFTLGPFKPWDWYSTWILGEEGVRWQQLRSKLKGRGHGNSVLDPLIAIPWLIAALMIRKWCWNQGMKACILCCCCGSGGGSNAANTAKRNKCTPTLFFYAPSSTTTTPATSFPTTFSLRLSILAAVLGITTICIALGIALACGLVPAQSPPLQGWILCYEWTILLSSILYGMCLKGFMYYGSTVATSQLHVRGSGGGINNKQQRTTKTTIAVSAWLHSMKLWCFIVVLLLLLPWWTDVMGVQSFVGKVLGTGVAAALTTLCLAPCFIAFAQVWYVQGVRRVEQQQLQLHQEEEEESEEGGKKQQQQPAALLFLQHQLHDV